MARNEPHPQQHPSPPQDDKPPVYHAPQLPPWQSAHRTQPTSSPHVAPPPQPSPQPQQKAGGQEQQFSGLNMQPGKEKQTIWMSRPAVPDTPDIPEEARQRHEESERLYPELNLSPGEFVISAIRRHLIGLISIWAVSGLLIFVSLAMIVAIATNTSTFLEPFGIASNGISSVMLISIPFLLLCILALVGGYIAAYVYKRNKFFLTNESVIQFLQISLFSHKEQTVNLADIEDASYRKHGIIQHIFNYGNIRLSTEGDETTYRFTYVKNPKHQIALLNNAVEAFKMGRPVIHLDDE